MKNFGRLLISALVATASLTSVQAQSESFADFRKKILGDFNDFRASVLDDYDKFLEAAWSDYEQITGEKSNPVPKPRTAPTVGSDIGTAIHTSPSGGNTSPRLQTETPASPQVGKPENNASAGQPASASGSDCFSIAGIPLEIPHIDYNIANRLGNTHEFGAHWRGLSQTDIAKVLIPEFRKLAETYGLNDYLTYVAVSSYVDTRFPKAHSSSRKSLVHYIMTNMGYDIRLGTNRSGAAMLLIPFNQMVYARPYLNIGGKKYFIFADEGIDLSNPDNLRISTCELPSGADTGKPLDLLLTGLRLPVTPHTYRISFGGITIEGELNRAIMPLLYRYPQMPTADFARSTVLPDVRRQIVDQLKAQLSGMDEQTAVNTLLQFIQKGFEYATDEDFHGFEKPYFIEETLFYPKNDCEDRAILYTYLLWEVLGVPNQLICYPGHESASVSLKNSVKGTSYTHSGQTFFISDPTYIGSVTGQCMPDYIHTTPQIDFSYK